ncbi:zinc-finger of mitochondrial splicing suppressor 51-domain-containing protein [Sphaerosporella brunnea]|uniref:Zinc-finger of mitochondrial splicing suppressor 51-domain-containing protein n=1 Tax=Sphaerosporella brunnea TaxID=1250544 RepID=A0A5J5EQN8_9PEZI|nr:zinc-finger of mitochondrial splicing suppressor 51-domain-containing protein [Sphaerosporella brunnea]
MASLQATSKRCITQLLRPRRQWPAAALARSQHTHSRKPPTHVDIEVAKAAAATAPQKPVHIPREIGPGVLEGEAPRVLLRPNNLFHAWDKSPSSQIRERASRIKHHAYCPHPEHKNSPRHIKFTCPDCGIPTYCSEEHWADDYENHLLICDALRESNEDEHDLRSGRFFPEFEYPGEQIEEQLINMTNWDTYLYTRGANAIDEDRQMRQVTKLLTYPITLASVVHELSPYDLRHRLTTEGLRSMAALRYNLHPPASGSGQDVKSVRINPPPVRLFILGARAESSLPRDVWYQLAYLFPRATFHLIFIGPESMKGREAEYPLPERTPDNPFGAVLERPSYRMKISTFVEYFHTLHEAHAFAPYDPYFDCFMLFHPGLGHPGSAAEWEYTLPILLDTKSPIICTGYTETDLKRDVDWVHNKCKGEFDVLLEPEENRFKSLRWDINDADPTDLSQSNWGLWAFRGKRYEATVPPPHTINP